MENKTNYRSLPASKFSKSISMNFPSMQAQKAIALKFQNKRHHSTDLETNDYMQRILDLRETPKSSGMSNLSQKLNLQVQSKTEKLYDQEKKSHMYLIGTNQRISSPKILSSDRHNGQKNIEIFEKKPSQYLIDRKSSTYLKIYTKAKKSPLKLNYILIKGKVVTYISRTTPEPSCYNFDIKSNQDYIEINERIPIFSTEWIYIGIHALRDTKILVTCRFGPEPFLDWIPKLVSKENKGHKKSMSVNDKDFVQANIQSCISSSAIKPKYNNWQERKKIVAERKKINEIAKKQRVLDTINRRASKEFKSHEQEIQDARDLALVKLQSAFFTLMTALKFMDRTKDIIDQRREVDICRLKRSSSVRKIQESFTNRYIRFNVSMNNLIRTKCLAVFYANCLRNGVSISSKVSQFIVSSSSNKNPETKFSLYVNSIVFIQKYWREALETKFKARMNRLMINESSKFVNKSSFRRKTKRRRSVKWNTAKKTNHVSNDQFKNRSYESSLSHHKKSFSHVKFKAN